MITRFKIFELHSNLKIGDFVLCEETDDVDKRVYEFTKNNIGKLVYIDEGTDAPYIVKYTNIPNDIFITYFVYEDGNSIGRLDYIGEPANGEKTCRRMLFKEIKYWSRDKEDLEMILAKQKYNL